MNNFGCLKILIFLKSKAQQKIKQKIKAGKTTLIELTKLINKFKSIIKVY